jgi:type I restriction enzyme S subunit
MSDMPPVEMRPDQWDIVQEILRKHVPDHEVWAFGSRARRTAKRYSDLDLAIISETPLPIRQEAMLAEAFSDSDLPWRVDIVDWATTSPAFRAIIEADRVVLQRRLP